MRHLTKNTMTQSVTETTKSANRKAEHMQALTTFQGIDLCDQWTAQSDALRQKAIALWQRNAILPPHEAAEERARQIVLVALDGAGDAVGVTTAYQGLLPAQQPGAARAACYFYRMFIQPQSRLPHLMRTMVTTTYDVLRNARQDHDPKVFAVITENPSLTKPGVLKLFARNGYHPQAKLPGERLLILKEF